MDFPPVPGSCQLELSSATSSEIEHTVVVGEVASLDHKVLDDAVERRALVSETLLAGSKSTVTAVRIRRCSGRFVVL